MLFRSVLYSVLFSHIDNQLQARADAILRKINAGYLNEILEQDCRFDDYNILKEQFIAIKSLDSLADTSQAFVIENQSWSVGGDDLIHRVIHKKFIYNNTHYELNIGEGLETIEMLDKTLVNAIIWLSIIILLITFFIDVGFVQILLRPFNRIVRKLQAINDPVQYKPAHIYTNTKEFEYLDQTFEDLMKRIQLQFNSEKEFIANVSHELQTPISILQNRFENIISESKTDDETTLKIIESQRTLSRLSKVIKSLLLISKIENAQYLKDESVIIGELIGDVMEDLRERFEFKSISTEVDIRNDFTLKHANRSLLYTMIVNLVNNAIKYNKEGGSIKIYNEPSDGTNQIIIEDTGIGIRKENLENIFDRFKRFHENDSNSFGLGLTIVKTIADFHNIHIHAASEENNGTIFTLIFHD